MHLVVATQPLRDVITGLMKANIPSRIAFAVDSALNSRIILDTMGAEKLVGKGDMLYSPLGSGKPLRVQGTFVTDSEREDVINFVKEQGLAKYSDEVMDEIERSADKDSKTAASSVSSGGDKAAQKDEETDELFNAAVEIILESGRPQYPCSSGG
jgi:S-DNA-T family DNA segregation ATPase FtsK/SpoIIIE